METIFDSVFQILLLTVISVGVSIFPCIEAVGRPLDGEIGEMILFERKHMGGRDRAESAALSESLEVVEKESVEEVAEGERQLRHRRELGEQKLENMWREMELNAKANEKSIKFIAEKHAHHAETLKREKREASIDSSPCETEGTEIDQLNCRLTKCESIHELDVSSWRKASTDIRLEYQKTIESLEANHKQQSQECTSNLAKQTEDVMEMTDQHRKKIETLSTECKTDKDKLQRELTSISGELNVWKETRVARRYVAAGGHTQLQGNGHNWGAWGTLELCPPGALVTAMDTKVQPHMGGGTDDTGLNAIKLRCNSYDDGVEVKTVMSTEGKHGSWEGLKECGENSWATGFSLKVESVRGDGDDTGATNFRLRCDHGGDVEGGGINFGDWSDVYSCPTNSFVCGISTQVEEDHPKDNIGLSNVRIRCCSMVY